MSYITEAVLYVDGNQALEAVIEAHEFREDGRVQKWGRLSTYEAGGTKVFCGAVYAAAFNYLGSDVLINWLKELKVAECFMISMSGEVNSERWFHMVKIGGQVHLTEGEFT